MQKVTWVPHTVIVSRTPSLELIYTRGDQKYPEKCYKIETTADTFMKLSNLVGTAIIYLGNKCFGRVSFGTRNIVTIET